MNRVLLAVFVVVLCVVFPQGCGKGETDVELIKGVIDSMAEAAESNDVKGVMRHISDNYKDERGNTRKQVKALVFSQLFGAKKISVFIRGVDVEVKEKKALADVKALLVLGKKIESVKDVLPKDAAGYRFSLVFTKEGGDWLITSAVWENVGGVGLL